MWMSVAVGVSVHSLTAYPVATFGTRDQQEALLPAMLSGEQLGAYCLSEPLAGSDIHASKTSGQRAPTPGGRSRAPSLDHARRARRLLHDLRAHVRRRRQGPVDVIVPGDAPGLTFAEPGEEDGPALRPPSRSSCSNAVPVRRGPARRARGAGYAHGPLGPRLWAPRDRRCRNGLAQCGP